MKLDLRPRVLITFYPENVEITEKRLPFADAIGKKAEFAAFLLPGPPETLKSHAISFNVNRDAVVLFYDAPSINIGDGVIEHINSIAPGIRIIVLGKITGGLNWCDANVKRFAKLNEGGYDIVYRGYCDDDHNYPVEVVSEFVLNRR